MSALRTTWAVEINRLGKDREKIEVGKRLSKEENDWKWNKDSINMSLEDAFVQIRNVKLQLDAIQKDAEKMGL
jgi:hypothetical protein